jgi:predicted alternative tryptophan synthase beta-subunit
MSGTDNEAFGANCRQLAIVIVGRYSSEMDFSDTRFVNVPIDIVESYYEINRVLPLLKGLLEGTTSPAEFHETAERLADNLWHLIDHLQDLNVALTEYDKSL